MKSAAIIAEYNPFHEGHIHHLQQSREKSGCSCLIVIVTGCFSSRGLPSLINTEDKTKLALQYGADLVIALPAVYAMQHANEFARYAIESLSCLKTDMLCFGSETNSLDWLRKMSQLSEEAIKDPSTSMARNMEKFMPALRPNDILAIQYLKWAEKYGIEPVSIQRNPDYKSATATRKDFQEGMEGQFKEEYFIREQNWNSYYPYLRLFLQMSSPDILRDYFLVDEGIEYRLIENARKYRKWDDFLEACISKTYSRARIQRTCVYIMLQITKEEMKEHSSFHEVIVLGMNETGRQYLKELKDQHSVLTRFKELSPFLKKVYIKTRALYDSVMPENSPGWRLIYEKMDTDRTAEPCRGSSSL